MLLFAILAISRIEGLVNGYIATAIGAVILVVWFFPPIGSLMIKSSSDRLALALFLLIGTLGSRLLGRRESHAS
jgi:K+-sensing histidine kinase KdpD